jgi:hypothetical protein
VRINTEVTRFVDTSSLFLSKTNIESKSVEEQGQQLVEVLMDPLV